MVYFLILLGTETPLKHTITTTIESWNS